MRLVNPVQRLLLALMTLILGMSGGGRVGVAWTCEGRVCSADLARCCCALPSASRDGDCAPSSVAKSPSACANRCGCKAVITRTADAPSIRQNAATVVAPTFDAIVPAPVAAFVAQAFVTLETPQVRALPPPDGLPQPPCLEHASLRAPPFATV